VACHQCLWILPLHLTTRRAADFDLRAPTTFADPGHRPTGQETREAMFLLPELGRGYLADVGIWPLRRANGREWEHDAGFARDVFGMTDRQAAELLFQDIKDEEKRDRIVLQKHSIYRDTCQP
jgi:hypothetical protein